MWGVWLPEKSRGWGLGELCCERYSLILPSLMKSLYSFWKAFKWCSGVREVGLFYVSHRGRPGGRSTAYCRDFQEPHCVVHVAGKFSSVKLRWCIPISHMFVVSFRLYTDLIQDTRICARASRTGVRGEGWQAPVVTRSGRIDRKRRLCDRSERRLREDRLDTHLRHRRRHCKHHLQRGPSQRGHYAFSCPPAPLSPSPAPVCDTARRRASCKLLRGPAFAPCPVLHRVRGRHDPRRHPRVRSVHGASDAIGRCPSTSSIKCGRGCRACGRGSNTSRTSGSWRRRRHMCRSWRRR